MRLYSIDGIEALTEQEGKEIAEEVLQIKGHTICLVNFEDDFGYSMLVFKDGHFIKDDFELHHRSKTREELKAWYVEAAHNTLFTDEELTAPLHSYDEYTHKQYFLNNYYGKRYGYISAFNIFHDDAERQAFKDKVKDLFYNPICFGYFTTPEPIEHMMKLQAALRASRDAIEQDYKYMKEAFLSELYNHEYAINWQGDWDVFSNFGHVEYGDQKGAADYMNELNFTEAQKKAFWDARREYYARQEQEA